MAGVAGDLDIGAETVPSPVHGVHAMYRGTDFAVTRGVPRSPHPGGVLDAVCAWAFRVSGEMRGRSECLQRPAILPGPFRDSLTWLNG